MSCVRRLLTVVMLLTVVAPRLAFAQEVGATLGVTRTIKSAILGEDRKVFVRLPTSYDTSGSVSSWRTPSKTNTILIRRFIGKWLDSRS